MDDDERQHILEERITLWTSQAGFLTWAPPDILCHFEILMSHFCLTFFIYKMGMTDNSCLTKEWRSIIITSQFFNFVTYSLLWGQAMFVLVLGKIKWPVVYRRNGCPNGTIWP